MPDSETTRTAYTTGRTGLAPGLPGIWSTALATLLVLVMLVLLLWIVTVNAFGWFWPASVWQITETDGTVHVGIEVDREPIPRGTGGENAYRLQLKVGNRDLLGIQANIVFAKQHLGNADARGMAAGHQCRTGR